MFQNLCICVTSADAPCCDLITSATWMMTFAHAAETPHDKRTRNRTRPATGLGYVGYGGVRSTFMILRLLLPGFCVAKKRQGLLLMFFVFTLDKSFWGTWVRLGISFQRDGCTPTGDLSGALKGASVITPFREYRQFNLIWPRTAELAKLAG